MGSVAAEKATVLTQEKEQQQETTTVEKQINNNMNVISIPYIPKRDVHWDFVMKEMMWLGADFKGERKRQNAAAKKLAYSVQKFHETKEKRRLRQLQQAEMKRKKLAAKMSRDVKGWWIKLEKVVAYKQKKNCDEERQKAMNKQLVALVRQTEKYTESLSNKNNINNSSGNIIHRVSTEEEDDDDDDDSDDNDNDNM